MAKLFPNPSEWQFTLNYQPEWTFDKANKKVPLGELCATDFAGIAPETSHRGGPRLATKRSQKNLAHFHNEMCKVADGHEKPVPPAINYSAAGGRTTASMT